MGKRHGPVDVQEEKATVKRYIFDVPYTIRKQKCKQSSGSTGSFVLSYTDNNGKKHRNCHTSRKKAKAQIAAIEAEGIEENTMKMKLSELRNIIRQIIAESKEELEEDEFTYAIAKAAEKGEKSVDIDGEKFPVKMSKTAAKDVLGKDKKKQK